MTAGSALLGSSPAPSPVVTLATEEYVGIAAGKYGLTALLAPVIIMLLANFIRVKLCRCIMYQSGDIIEGELEKPTTLELTELKREKKEDGFGLHESDKDEECNDRGDFSNDTRANDETLSGKFPGINKSDI